MLSNWIKSKYNGKKLYYKTNKQLKVSGSVIELRLFGADFYVGGRPETVKKEKTIKTIAEADKELAQKQRFWRAKRKFYDCINCNVFAWPDTTGHIDPPLFTTLTFADNVQDITTANYEFTKYIQRFNFFITKKKESYLKYIVVIEFQKRGAVHYHIMFFNMPFITDLKTKLADIWDQGFTNFKSLKDSTAINKTIRYMSKYMSKSFNDARLFGKKCYFISKFVKKPRLIYFDDQINDLLTLIPAQSLEYYSDTPTEGYIPLIEYTRYNLNNYPQALKQFLAFLDITGYDILDTTPTELDVSTYISPNREVEFPLAYGK